MQHLLRKHCIKPLGAAVQLQAALNQHAHIFRQHVFHLGQFFGAYIRIGEAEARRRFSRHWPAPRHWPPDQWPYGAYSPQKLTFLLAFSTKNG